MASRTLPPGHSYGFCADCESTTTLTEHGACSFCGSNSVLSRARFLPSSKATDEGVGSPRVATLPALVVASRLGAQRQGCEGSRGGAAVTGVRGGASEEVASPVPGFPSLHVVPALGGPAAGCVSSLSGGAAPHVVLGGAA